MVPESEQQQVIDHSQKVLAGKSQPAIEHHIVRKDGAIRWVSDTPILKYDAQGGLVSYDGVIKDITERKRAEEKISALNADLEQRVSERTAQLRWPMWNYWPQKPPPTRPIGPRVIFWRP